MALRIQSAFGAGELDPALHERTTFEKYKAGLATLRNMYVGKTGRLISRPGSIFAVKPKYDDRKCILYSPPYSGIYVEWGHEYVRIHDSFDSASGNEVAHTLTEDDLPFIHFAFAPNVGVANSGHLYVFRKGVMFKRLDLVGSFDPAADLITVPDAPTGSTQAGTGTGYAVEYVTTIVVEGEESFTSAPIAGRNLPIASPQTNNVRAAIPAGYASSFVSEMRVYRRPAGAGAYGYIGSSFERTSGPDKFEFLDVGQDADFTHSPPDYLFDFLKDADSFTEETEFPRASGIEIFPATGTIYQQRLVVSGTNNDEAIHTSRPGFRSNFTRDFPLNAASSLTFKSGTDGNAKVLRLADIGPLAAFTTIGLYTNDPGALSPTNIAMSKKGEWVIDDIVAPLIIPGAVLFVDKLTNAVIALNFSEEQARYDGKEISIFSNHLIENKRIVSWAFQDGVTPLVWCVMDDGSMVALTYQREQEMRAWSRHDSAGGKYESVAMVKDYVGNSRIVFVIERQGKRFIEYFSLRNYPDVSGLYTDDIKNFVGMDSTVTDDNNLSLMIGLQKGFSAFPLDLIDWNEILDLKCVQSFFADVPGFGGAGTIYKHFDSEGAEVELEVVEFIDDKNVRVQPSAEFPMSEAANFTLYGTVNEITELDHLEGREVSVVVDGYVEGSPNNVLSNYPGYIVTGGKITLENGKRGSIIHVGLPYAIDWETLDVDTVEQKPTLLESVNCNSAQIKVYKTGGLYVGNSFPLDDSNAGMTDPVLRHEDDDDVLGNAAEELVTERIDFTIPGDWNSHGRICGRQVDPVPVEILSIIPNLEINRR